MTEDTIKQEYAQVKAGTHFWCQTHLSAVPVEKRSADPRYCQGCYDFLVEEYRMMAERGTTKRPSWIPNPLPETPKQDKPTTFKAEKAVSQDITLSRMLSDVVTARKTVRALSVDGKQQRSAVDVAIEVLTKQGLTCRAIADRLGQQGYDVSYRTVARRMKQAVTA